MDLNQWMNMDEVNFEGVGIRPFLLGLLSAFDNRYQACADSFFREITWKQFFAVVCIRLCRENPTINELAAVMQSSHQNVKQILNKLEKKGFVKMIQDEKDKRKLRIMLTQDCVRFCEKNSEASNRNIEKIFDGIREKDILTTIQTIITMERNIEKV